MNTCLLAVIEKINEYTCTSLGMLCLAFLAIATKHSQPSRYAGHLMIIEL